ncbi:MAG: hypothetical protein AB7I19_09335 [Planctomycetota bacterium]
MNREPATDEPDLPPTVYWGIALAAIATMLLLGWLTASYHLPVGGSR